MRRKTSLASMPEFRRLWDAGCSKSEIAKRLGFSLWTVKNVGQKLKWRHPASNVVGELAKAPSDEEELLSQGSLDLAPSVAERAAAIKLDCYTALRNNQPLPYRRK